MIMRPHNLPKCCFVLLALVWFTPQLLLAQYAVSTVAGGGPSNLAALSAKHGLGPLTLRNHESIARDEAAGR